ncbi:MAG: hypothetical protein HQ537_00760 [Parcubacteria group bacterium]|nr:hypothetical protein [Parcubacteria group bacterium]
MEKVLLRNGSEIDKNIVVAIMVGMEMLLKTENPMDKHILLYELRERCKNPNHEFYADSEEKLKQYGLIQSIGIHESARNIILSAIKEEEGGAIMTWESPMA